MKQILKYLIPGNDFTILLPKGAEILTVHSQDGAAVMWAIVDQSLPGEYRRFINLGTGQVVPSGDLRYIGSFGLDGWSLVGHLFEARP